MGIISVINIHYNVFQSNGQMPPPSMIMGMPSTPMVPHSQSGINSFNQSGEVSKPLATFVFVTRLVYHSLSVGTVFALQMLLYTVLNVIGSNNAHVFVS